MKIQGVSPLLMHSALLNDPMAEITKALKKINAKRKKVDADLEEMSKLEFYGGIYVDKEGYPILPSTCLEACIVEGAKAEKLGKKFKATVFVDGDPRLIYDGPKDVDGLWEAGTFRDTRRVKVGMSGVMRTRPRFDEWALSFPILYVSSAVTVENVESALVTAGQMVGLCDFRPRFGRFQVVDFKPQ